MQLIVTIHNHDDAFFQLTLQKAGVTIHAGVKCWRCGSDREICYGYARRICYVVSCCVMTNMLFYARIVYVSFIRYSRTLHARVLTVTYVTVVISRVGNHLCQLHILFTYVYHHVYHHVHVTYVMAAMSRYVVISIIVISTCIMGSSRQAIKAVSTAHYCTQIIEQNRQDGRDTTDESIDQTNKQNNRTRLFYVFSFTDSVDGHNKNRCGSWIYCERIRPLSQRIAM